MDNKLEIIILSENSVEKRNLIAEHGLSFWLKYGKEEYLFDTGQGEVLFHNAKKLNIDLNELKAVILSHGHDDHTGGLKKLPEVNPEIEVFAHEDAFIPKYKVSEGEHVFIGNEVEIGEIKKFSNLKGKADVCKGINSTGEIKVEKEEYIKNKYRVKYKEGERIDPFNDDISLYIETEKGLVVLLGCSHKGVTNIIEQIKQKSSGKKIRAIIGGMHLKHTSDEKIWEIIEYLENLDFELLAPIHCTGQRAAMMMKERFGERVELSSVGDHFEF